jgi:hypothetical protein
VIRRGGEVLTARALNRALLDRQMLLRRRRMTAAAAIDRLVGLQAQVPNAPYLALWTRLQHFTHHQLTRLIMRRRVVRLAMMRSTIHMVGARDCLELRPLLQPASDRGLQGTFGRRLAGIDLEALAAAARTIVDERPRSLTETGALLARRWRGRDPFALAHAARAVLPLVQVPPRGVWGDGGAPLVTSAEQWLGRPLARRPSIQKLMLRYLAAFGPASVRDAQAWSGLTALGDVFERLRPRLLAFRDSAGRELFDVPRAPRPDPDVEAPPRFLPEFDNVLLAHADRSRILPPDFRGMVFGRGALLEGVVLVDGFAAGRWRLTRARGDATLSVHASVRLLRRDRSQVIVEGERLLAFAAADAKRRDVRVI